MNTTKQKCAKYIMLSAAAYNLFWSAVISLHPQLILFGNPPATFTLILLKCIGMLVGVYGIAYYYASTNPTKYWPLIFVGFIGKVLGPIGSAYYVATSQLTPNFLWVNVYNDLIWLFPFGWILY